MIDAMTNLITRYFQEVWNEGHVDALDELLTADYLNHSPSTPNPPRGPAGLKPIVRAMREAIPDLHYEILDMVVTPDKAAIYLRVTGTQAGRPIDVRQMQIEWIKDGRIWQHWRITDELALMRQLGANE
jgi:ketosteroid isomerase-like protein